MPPPPPGGYPPYPCAHGERRCVLQDPQAQWLSVYRGRVPVSAIPRLGLDTGRCRTDRQVKYYQAAFSLANSILPSIRYGRHIFVWSPTGPCVPVPLWAAQSVPEFEKMVRVTGMSVAYSAFNPIALLLNAVLSMTIQWQTAGAGETQPARVWHPVLASSNNK
eukprot:5834546-Pyramimonas_sp.AAC.1